MLTTTTSQDARAVPRPSRARRVSTHLAHPRPSPCSHALTPVDGHQRRSTRRRRVMIASILLRASASSVTSVVQRPALARSARAGAGFVEAAAPVRVDPHADAGVVGHRLPMRPRPSLLLGLGALALAACGTPAAAVDLADLSVQQRAAAARYAATVTPAADQASCQVALTAELVRTRLGRAPRVVRRMRSTTDVCASGEGDVSFIAVRARGRVSTRGLPAGRYLLRLRAEALGTDGAPRADTVAARMLLRVLVIRPPRVRRGRWITISGSGWPARASVLLAVGPPRTSPGETIARVRTTRRGTFSRRARIDPRAGTGPYVGIALLANGEKSSARFRIV